MHVARGRKKKGERYIDRWLQGKKRLGFVLKEEEFEAIKKFCDEHKVSYREFFTQIAPRLLIENQELKKKIEELSTSVVSKEEEIARVSKEYDDLVQAYNMTIEKLKEVKGELDRVSSLYNKAITENSALKKELERANSEVQALQEKVKGLEAQLSSANSELQKVKGVLDMILKNGHAELDPKFCPQLKEYGFKVREKEVTRGFMKKETIRVCSNGNDLDYL
mgnify:CR=1 FL=1